MRKVAVTGEESVEQLQHQSFVTVGNKTSYCSPVLQQQHAFYTQASSKPFKRFTGVGTQAVVFLQFLDEQEEIIKKAVLIF